jgi:1,5-anhydro-D-fructose reductase (1,5-anhydro-D-mannitol-forming)
MHQKGAAVPDSSSRALRIGVAGFWHVHAAEYARLAQAHPRTELVAVWDDDPDRGSAGSRDLGVESVGSLAELIDRTDGVLVTTATSSHRDVMTALAEAGRHMFAEKVLAPTVAEAQQILAAAERNDVRVVVSLPRLYHGYTRAISDVIRAGRLGQVSYGRVRLSHDGATAGWLPERFFDPDEAVGGALIDLGCHPVYLTQFFLGERPETVSATYGRLTSRAVEDQAVVTLGYADGAIGVAETGFVSSPGFRIELYGTDASLHYSDDGGLRLRARSGAEELSVPPDGPDAFRQWVEHIDAGTAAEDNLARAVELTRLVVAANTAAATSRAVAYP